MVKGVKYMMMEEALILGGGHAMQQADHVSYNCTLYNFINQC